MHGVEWVWLIMVSPLVVPHVDWDGCVKGGEEVMGTCKEEREVTNRQQNTADQTRRVMK